MLSHVAAFIIISKTQLQGSVNLIALKLDIPMVLMKMVIVNAMMDLFFKFTKINPPLRVKSFQQASRYFQLKVGPAFEIVVV